MFSDSKSQGAPGPPPSLQSLEVCELSAPTSGLQDKILPLALQVVPSRTVLFFSSAFLPEKDPVRSLGQEPPWLPF